MMEFPDTPEDWQEEALAANMQIVQDMRDGVNEKIEPMRAAKDIRSSLEASVQIKKDDALLAALEAIGALATSDDNNPTDTLADYLIVSEAHFGEDLHITVLKDDPAYTKCERSWKYFKAENNATITTRDAISVAQWDKANG
jgi:isoleucyl-tRNA synthetase